MLANNLPIVKKEASSFEPLPEDIYQVELLDITAEEKETYNSKIGKTTEKEYETILSFQFTLLDGDENGKSLRGRNVWANFIPSYLYVGKNGKNKLYQIVEALQGQLISPQQEAEGLNGAFLNSLIGKQCRVVTKNKANKEGNLFTNIDSFLVTKMLINALTQDEKDNATVKKDKQENQENTGAQDFERNEYAQPTTQHTDIESNMPQYDNYGNPSEVVIPDDIKF